MQPLPAPFPKSTLEGSALSHASARVEKSREVALTSALPSSHLVSDSLLLYAQEKTISLNFLRLMVHAPIVNVNAKEKIFGWTAGHFLANAGKAKAVKYLLDNHADITSVCNQQNTVLHIAARGGWLDTVQFLVARKAHLDAKNKFGYTPLIWSAMNGHEMVVSALVAAKCNFNAIDLQGRTASMWAVRHGFADVVYSLLAGSIDMHVEDNAGMTIIDHAKDRFDNIVRGISFTFGYLMFDDSLPSHYRLFNVR